MPDTDLQLAALIGSRICHDLISPIGAINNGLELLSMEGALQGPELALIHDSGAHADARIRFFRVAFGAAGSRQMLSAREVRALLTAYAAGSRHRPDYRPEEDLPRAELRLAFLALLCAETALPQGGVLRLDRAEDRWQLAAEGPRIALSPSLAVRLDPRAAAGAAAAPDTEDDAPDDALSPAQVQFALLPPLAKAAGRAITLSLGADHLSLTV